uniref:Ion transport domain-containing protein n=1 Tax=Vitrella brassicaformis TaxID=1169539 RepID=A0A7S1P5L9_9ALVE
MSLFYVSVGDFRGVVDTAFDEDLVLVGVLVIVFVIVSFIIALNLLIALFTTTFSTILETSKAQYEQLRIKVLNEYSYSYICTELPIPLNFLPGLLPCLMLSRYIQGRVAKQVEHLSNPQAPKKHESVQLVWAAYAYWVIFGLIFLSYLLLFGAVWMLSWVPRLLRLLLFYANPPNWRRCCERHCEEGNQDKPTDEASRVDKHKDDTARNKLSWATFSKACSCSKNCPGFCLISRQVATLVLRECLPKVDRLSLEDATEMVRSKILSSYAIPDKAAAGDTKTMNTPYVHPRFDVLGAEMPESLEVLLNKSIWDQADHQTATMGDISKGLRELRERIEAVERKKK